MLWAKLKVAVELVPLVEFEVTKHRYENWVPEISIRLFTLADGAALPGHP